MQQRAPHTVTLDSPGNAVCRLCCAAAVSAQCIVRVCNLRAARKPASPGSASSSCTSWMRSRALMRDCTSDARLALNLQQGAGPGGQQRKQQAATDMPGWRWWAATACSCLAPAEQPGLVSNLNLSMNA